MADIGAIGKDQKNQQQRYNFRGIDDVLNHCNPALVKHGVSVGVEVIDHSIEEVQTQKGFRTRAVAKMAVTFFAPDGSCVSNTTVGEAADYNGDKATNKAMAAAMKYAFFFGLVIPVQPGVVDDSDHDDKLEDAVKTKFDATEAKAGPDITEKQRSAIIELCSDHDIGDDRLARGCGHVSGTRTETVADLTKAEAEDLILLLNKIGESQQPQTK